MAETCCCISMSDKEVTSSGLLCRARIQEGMTNQVWASEPRVFAGWLLHARCPTEEASTELCGRMAALPSDIVAGKDIRKYYQVAIV